MHHLISTRLTTLISTIESSIDPINYAVARSGVISQLTLSLTRCTVLYGTLIRLNPYPVTFRSSASDASTASSTTSATSASDAANILPLAAPSARHNALPATLYPVKMKTHDQYAPAASPAAASGGSSVPTVITLSSLGSSSQLLTPSSSSSSAAGGLSLPSLSVNYHSPGSNTSSSTSSFQFGTSHSASSFLDRVGLDRSSADHAAREIAEKGKDIAEKATALLGKFSTGLSNTFSKEGARTGTGTH